MKVFQLLLGVLCLSSSLAKQYVNYKVYDVTPDKEQVKKLMTWQFEAGVDFWTTGGAGRTSRVMVSPEVESSFSNFLNSNKIQHKLAISDVESSLQADKAARLMARSKRSVFKADNIPSFEQYLEFGEMLTFTRQLAENYPNLVQRDVIGNSIEGREIFGMRISSGAVFGKKPIIFIDSGVHAREWVGHQSTLYLLSQLVTNETVSKELLDKVDWVIVPNVNPDGYVYSMENDRLWRKNRRFVNESCTGIDLNRNFAYVWQYRPNSCATLGYPGAHALSEPETVALTSYMESFKYNLRMYLSTHSYGNYLLWPFGFDFGVYIKNWKEHTEVGQRWVDVVQKATGTFYELGNSADILYTANGASDDHAVAFANANLAFTLELTGGGPNGFDYPEEKVFDLVQETFLGYREFGLYIGEHYNYD